MSTLYPAMLRLDGRRCVVIGGGQVAARKIARLVAAGAAVTVIAPEWSPEIEALVAEGVVRGERRAYQQGDLAGAALAFAATSSRSVNRAVAAEADQAGIPVNVADDPAASSFFVPAVVQRDQLTVAVSTAGTSPAFARELRLELERLLSPERLQLLELYAELRAELRAGGTSSADLDWEGSSAGLLELLRQGHRAAARERLRERVLATTVRED